MPRIDKEHRKCKHGKQKLLCRDCSGYKICEYNRIKWQCVVCGGRQKTNAHNQRKFICRGCCGSQICIHKRHKRPSVEFGGSQIPLNKWRKYECEECSPYLKNTMIYYMTSHERYKYKTKTSFDLLNTCAVVQNTFSIIQILQRMKKWHSIPFIMIA